MRYWERINFTKGIDEYMRIRKESNMFNSVNQKSPKMYQREEKKKQNSNPPAKQQQNYRD
jgi:hypothetical protein